MSLKHFSTLAIFMGLSLAQPTLNAADPLEPPKLTLSASAVISKPADELQLKIGVVNLGIHANEAIVENSQKMNAVVASIESLGLYKGDYETGQFSIQPTYTPYPKNPPADWKPSINGYQVTNSVNVHTNKLDIAGKLIDVANKAGANTITDIQFGLHEPRIYWTEALQAAVTNAINDADAIAHAAHVQLVRILSITLDNTNVITPQVNTAYLAKMSYADNSPPIEPGEVKIHANVTLIYEISSK